jgi:hypothetical protein
VPFKKYSGPSSAKLSITQSGWKRLDPTTYVPDNTQHSQDRDTHASDEVRTRSPNNRAAADPHLRLPNHWDRFTKTKC